MTAAAMLPPPPAASEAPDHIVLYDMSWDYYERTIEEAARSNLRITYDGGTLEMMTTSFWHEEVKTSIARLLETFSLETGTRVRGFGSPTCRRKDLKRGLEPDECYYVKTPPPPRGTKTLDLRVHAPPDLAVEVEVSRSSIPRVPIYAALGVPEVWRFSEGRIIILHRQSDGQYATAAESLAFPDLPMAEFNRFLTMALTTDQHDAVVAFRDWLRARRG
jgi:Uma2 family endonuclease